LRWPGMPDGRPSLEDFWRRLEMRHVEPDLAAMLRERTRREVGSVRRLADRATVEAVASRILPGAVPAAALAVFLDENFDQQLGRAEESAGRLPRDALLPLGFTALDAAGALRAGEAAGPVGGAFARLGVAEQDLLLESAERGVLAAPAGVDATRFSSSDWFRRIRDLLLLAYGSDPRGMVQMGFPGPSYEPGNLWLDQLEVAQRDSGAPGATRF
jgi:hypothetical protein